MNRFHCLKKTSLLSAEPNVLHFLPAMRNTLAFRMAGAFFALSLGGMLASAPARADDMTSSNSSDGMPPAVQSLFASAHGMDGHGDHATIPAGVFGAHMIGAGSFSFNYTPMFMQMADNYIGTSLVSPQQIATTVPSSTMMGMMHEDYRIVPTTMEVQMHMLHAMYGVTDWLNLMVMADYQQRTMTMTTFAGATGTRILGQTTQTSEGFGDTHVMSLVRLYQDQINHVHLNLGLSLPSGSTTETMTMLSPMGMQMTMRGSYGMQLGTGTVDFLPGITYTGQWNQWSWGSAYRGRVALDNNAEGYHYGYQHVLTGWGGYTWLPGITTTARVAGSEQDIIHGSDPLISGLMQGTNPLFYGGKRIDLFGGLEIAGAPFGLGPTHLAIEIGGPVYQNLNGPQLGQSWELTASAGVHF